MKNPQVTRIKLEVGGQLISVTIESNDKINNIVLESENNNIVVNDK